MGLLRGSGVTGPDAAIQGGHFDQAAVQGHLFEEEGDVCGGALVAQGAQPVEVTGAGGGAGFGAGDNPIDLAGHCGEFCEVAAAAHPVAVVRVDDEVIAVVDPVTFGFTFFDEFFGLTVVVQGVDFAPIGLDGLHGGGDVEGGEHGFDADEVGA